MRRASHLMSAKMRFLLFRYSLNSVWVGAASLPLDDTPPAERRETDADRLLASGIVLIQRLPCT